MNQRSLGVLIALNVVLLIALAVTSFTTRPAQAQVRNPGTYTMTAGSAIGQPNRATLYILERNSMRLAVMQYSSSDKVIYPMDMRQLDNDMK